MPRPLPGTKVCADSCFPIGCTQGTAGRETLGGLVVAWMKSDSGFLVPPQSHQQGPVGRGGGWDFARRASTFQPPLGGRRDCSLDQWPAATRHALRLPAIVTVAEG